MGFPAAQASPKPRTQMVRVRDGAFAQDAPSRDTAFLFDRLDTGDGRLKHPHFVYEGGKGEAVAFSQNGTRRRDASYQP